MIFRTLSLLSVLVVLVGCGGGEAPPMRQDAREVQVDWLGRESFRITSSLGTEIITNPYLGAFPDGQRPDIVLISSERSDANNVDAFDNSPTVFRGAVGIGANTATGLSFRGIPTWEDPAREMQGQLNLVFTFVLDGLRFCYLGHLENPLTISQIQQIGAVDVLFLPTGSSLSDSARTTVIGQLRPRVILPMGSGAAAWAGRFGKVYRVPGPSVLFSRPTMPAEQTALVFGSTQR